MNLTWIDWTILAVAVIALRFVSLSTRKHMQGVADFLSANRSAGRYLLTIAGEMGNTGAISLVAFFEIYYLAGFPPVWWNMMWFPATAIILLTGWVYYRFRETRALTLAQFLEMRYSRRFRILSGLLIWLCGIINFGIFPAVAARFFMYFCGIPEHFHIPGLPWMISTYPAIMTIDLGLALMFVTMGGQISVMVTECVQGIVSAFAFVIIIAAVLIKLKWSLIVQALGTAPANASLMNPFHTSGVKDFNFWFFAINIFGMFYGYMSWQGASGFNSAGRSPHETKMGGIIATFRTIPLQIMIVLLPIAAYAVMHLPQYSGIASVVNHSLKGIDNEAVQSQMRVPLVLAHFLPVGVKGLLAMVMLFFSFTCHDTYMHSWGSIFIQDVVMPFRQRPLTPEQHIRLLRYSIVGVAVFAFFFSLLYQQTTQIIMFMAITGTIYTGGAGVTIFGGLYWKKGTTPAAYVSLIFGAILGLGSVIIFPIYKSHFHKDFPVNGQWLWMIAMATSLVLYIVVSLLTCKKGQGYNLEKMLHRGTYIDPDKSELKEPSRWLQLIGITAEFSYWDRIIALAVATWNFGWLLVFAVVSTISLVWPKLLGNAWWAAFWHTYIWVYFLVGLPVTVWFTIGGVIDIKMLFKTLESKIRDHTDDGSVRHDPEDEVVPALSPVLDVVSD